MALIVPRLDDATARRFRRDKLLRRQMRRALDLALRFYGLGNSLEKGVTLGKLRISRSLSRRGILPSREALQNLRGHVLIVHTPSPPVFLFRLPVHSPLEDPRQVQHILFVR